MSLFRPTPERAVELVAAANRRAESLAVRLVRAEQYAKAKGDQQLLSLLAGDETSTSSGASGG